jgi:hypothetical protein
MTFFRLFCASVPALLLIAIGTGPAHATPAAESSAGVIVGVTGHVVVERPAAPPRAATLGMRLDAADVVVVDRGAVASIYLKGGGVVRLTDATRFELPKAADAPARGSSQAKLQSGTIAQLENGLWVLNDPAGSLLVSPMRGEGAWGSSETPVPLSPRYEALTEAHAVFVWSGGPAKARVVVAQRREPVWRSAPTAPGTVLDAGTAFPLVAGEVYTWWLEPEAGGPPLTAGVSFRMAAADVLARTKAIEAELRSLAGTAEGAAAADYLRVAHYVGASSWTRVLGLAMRMPQGEARDRAIEAASAGLRLDEHNRAALSERLEANPKP